MNPPQSPAGAYTPEPDPSPARRAELIAEVEQLPAAARTAVAAAGRAAVRGTADRGGQPEQSGAQRESPGGHISIFGAAIMSSHAPYSGVSAL
jgi:hypothetical protein